MSALRKILQSKINQLEAQSVATSQDRATVMLDQQSVGRLSRMDAMQQQAMANATESRRLAEILRAKSALNRMEEGEFGYCTDCGEHIETARLHHDPSLPLCLECAQ